MQIKVLGHIIILANYIGCKLYSDLIQSHDSKLTQSMAKHVQKSYNWFWFSYGIGPMEKWHVVDAITLLLK